MASAWTGIAMLSLAAICGSSGQGSAGAQISGTASPAGSVAGPKQAVVLHARDDRYRLRGGDSFEVDFVIAPEFNDTVAVQPDGYISLKGAGTVHVEGQTLPEVTETIKTAYSLILRDPRVTVSLKDFERPYFIAGGKVGKPGKYDLRTSLTLSQAVAIAGGFTEDSMHSQVVLFRPMPDGNVEAKVVDVKHLLATRNLAEDPVLQTGDTLYVPQNRISKIRKYLPTTAVGAYLNNLY